MISYTLLDNLSTVGRHDGDIFPSGNLARWALTVDLLRLTGYTSADVVIEASPTVSDPVWTDVHRFTLTAAGSSTVYTFAGAHGAQDSDGAMGRYFRAKVENLVGSGSYVVNVLAVATVLDVQDETDLLLLQKEIRDWSELPRAMAEAEGVLRGHLGGTRNLVGRLRANAWDPDFETTLRLALARQVAWIALREKSTGDERRSYLKRVVAPDAEEILRPLLDESAAVWRGR